MTRPLRLVTWCAEDLAAFVATLESVATLEGETRPWNLTIVDRAHGRAQPILAALEGDVVIVPAHADRSLAAQVVAAAGDGRADVLVIPPGAEITAATLEVTGTCLVTSARRASLWVDADQVARLRSHGAGPRPGSADVMASLAADLGITVEPRPQSGTDLEVLAVATMAGRTGSTLLMQLLGTSPEIAFDRQYPFENRYLTSLVQATDALRTPETTPFLAAADERDRFADASLAGAWHSFTELTRRDRPDAVWHAEKAGAVALHPQGLRGLAGRVLHLVRDPRDVWASIHAFDAKRGYHGFGRAESQSRAEYLREFAATVTTRLDAMASTRPDRSVLVRYEDLIIDLDSEAERVGAWIGTALDADAVRAQQSTMAHHMTSSDPKASIGRWRHDLPDDEVRLLTGALGSRLEPFGYTWD